LIGNLTGNATGVNLVQILMQNVRIQGVLVGSRDTLSDESSDLIARTGWPVIDRVFAFDEARQAFRTHGKRLSLWKDLHQVLIRE
jgi:hypothetical protein